MESKTVSLDDLIIEFDKGIRTVLGAPGASRPSPAGTLPEPPLTPEERRHAAALMRVNHCGEVCAQALYQGQALASRDPGVKAELERAAREESDHLAWSARRIAELGGRPSVLNPLWYAGSLAIGYAAGRLGDAWNLGFLAETEKQVERHLHGHLERLSERDARTRAVITAMRDEEAGHARRAEELGARELPDPFKRAMRAASRVMTSTSYWV
ncbi:MAG: 2-polyprenyl-3-methyl-6-methoxy-1,4-benzoquinone monooxygenase [Betaproteobacteria bacterium]|nr:2-polyprenyl-3-methyl-6-methoxy-1,4-benzoquinone monooxygenase [Betaproteobacteria bacterium]